MRSRLCLSSNQTTRCRHALCLSHGHSCGVACAAVPCRGPHLSMIMKLVIATQHGPSVACVAIPSVRCHHCHLQLLRNNESCPTQTYNRLASFLGDDRAARAKSKWGKPLKAVVITNSGMA